MPGNVLGHREPDMKDLVGIIGHRGLRQAVTVQSTCSRAEAALGTQSKDTWFIQGWQAS